jgi:hypothetical protein
MWRLAAADGDITHIWTDDPPTTTYCGYVGEARPGTGVCACGPCIRTYGADLDAAFPHVAWLARGWAATKHAFEPDTKPDRDGRIRPVCDIRPYRPEDLTLNEFVQRCPHCVDVLRHRARSAGT